jgi:cyclophilin family peptidyl-prolyl cis-trans isomerase
MFTISKKRLSSTVLLSVLCVGAVTGCAKSKPVVDTAASTEVAGAGGAFTPDPNCPAADGSAPQKRAFSDVPPACVDPAKTYSATMETSKGTIEILLDQKRAPIAVNSFVFLARQHYFDGIVFHRIIPGFVLQGGDPYSIDNGGPVGTGGPGYKFADELPAAGEYKYGSLAMANSGPNTNGSQFFVISGPAGIALDPLYSLFGQTTKGEDVIKTIDALGSPGGTPNEKVTILKVTITES